jgi:hypothetical protein
MSRRTTITDNLHIKDTEYKFAVVIRPYWHFGMPLLPEIRDTGNT